MKYLAFLSGPITGLSYDGCTDWREQAIHYLRMYDIQGLNPMRGKDYLRDQDAIGDSYEDSVLSCQRGIMTRDYNDATRSDIVIVNFLGATRASIGTAMELAWAYQKQIPIIAVMEETGNVHDHCMIREAIGFRVTTLEEACKVAHVVLNANV